MAGMEGFEFAQGLVIGLDEFVGRLDGDGKHVKEECITAERVSSAARGLSRRRWRWLEHKPRFFHTFPSIWPTFSHNTVQLRSYRREHYRNLPKAFSSNRGCPNRFWVCSPDQRSGCPRRTRS